MSMDQRAFRLALPALLAFFALKASAWESHIPTAAVPDYLSPWIESKKPDVHTALLWKFNTEKDRVEEGKALLAGDDLDKLLKGDDPGLAGSPDGAKESAPVFSGGARPEAGAGRFGGGLALDGKGYASGEVPLKAIHVGEGGFAADLWFKPAAGGTGGDLLALGDAAGKPLFRVTLERGREAGDRVALEADGVSRLSVPVPATSDGWHHLALIFAAPAEGVGVPPLALAVDGERAEVAGESGAWFKGLPGRLGTILYAGGAPERPGFRGVVDEVRVTKGRKYFYDWMIGRQAGWTDEAPPELKAPYFRSGRLLTRFRFEGGLRPEAFAGLSWTGSADAVHFQPGLRGRALDLSQIDKTGFEMKGFHILPEKDGTIEFWFRPLNWNNFYVGEYDGRDVPASWMMALTAKGASYPSKDIEFIRGRAGRDANLRYRPFHPGTWIHVLISLRGGGQSVYLNGRKQKLWQAGFVTQGHPYAQEPLKKWRAAGAPDDGTWSLAFRNMATLVDEFSVYSWGLNDEEAWNAYARWLPDAKEQMKPLPLFRLDFDYFAHSFNAEEKLVARLTCLDAGGAKPASADFEIADAGGKALLKAEGRVLDEGGNATFTVSNALAFGRYPVTIRSRDAAGAVIREEKREYVREKPVWMGNTLGAERTVPKPWTAMTVAGKTVGVIGREVELGPNGLPARIDTHGRALLKAPVAMRVAGPAGAGELTGQGAAFTETAADRVAWKAALSGAGLAADLDAWMEFDGLLYAAVTLKPQAGGELSIDELDVDFTFHTNRAFQLLANGGGNDFRASWICRYVPEGTGSVWRSSDKPYPAFGRAQGYSNFMPHIWLGADEEGLYFGAENDQGWTVDGPRPAQEILRQEGAVVFRLNVIREPTVIPAAGRRFHFILLPTPAKPEPPDWRKQMLTGVNFGSCDSFGGHDMKTDPADPEAGDDFRLEPRSWEHAARMAPLSRAKWGRCILYADMSWPRFGPSFADWNHDLHAGTGRLALFPEMEDYMVWAVNEFLKRGLIDGVYWDDVSVGHTLSLASTAYAWPGSPNGRRAGFTALAQRRINMRLWRLFEAAGREPGIWAHMTVCYEVPLFSFCRYLSNLEFVTGVDFPGSRDAMDAWTPDTLRILGGSAKWGTGSHCLSTLPRTLPTGPAAAQWSYPQNRTESALYITSDVMQLPDPLGRKLVEQKLFDAPVSAYPWWKSGEAVRMEAPTGSVVRAIVYQGENRAVVVAANWDRKAEREVALEIVPEVLGFGPEVVWRDLDPGLKPPAAVAASASERAKVKPTDALGGVTGEKEELEGEALQDFLDGTDPAERALKRLVLKTEGNRARVVIRPRDYRVLEVRPR